MSTNPPPAGEPEYLGSSAPAPFADGPAGARRRTGVLVAAAVGVTAALGLGGWGVLQLMSGGGSPAEAVPANAVGYLSVDLDPSATQKIEAIQMIQKFPALEEQLDLDARADLRRWIFEKGIGAEEGCGQVDYASDVEPWLGHQIAIAAVPDSDRPVSPVFVLEVRDPEAARAGIAVLDECGNPGEPSGVAFVGDYMLLAEHQDDATAFAAAAEAAPLADDQAFRGWLDRLGDPGIITAYASADAPELLFEEMSRALPHQPDTLAEGDLECKAPCPGVSADLPGFDEYTDLARRAYKDFEGMAGVIRFDDGGIEAELVTRGMDPTGALATGAAGPSLADLPESTALAFGFAVPDGWAQDLLDTMERFAGAGPGTAGMPSSEELLAQMEAETGLQLPEDFQTLLGDGITVSVDGGVDLSGLTGSSAPDPGQIPFGLRIDGDPAEIRPVLDKLLATAGPAADQLVVAEADGAVVLGLQRDYVDRLARGGALGDSDSFQRVVPEADRASSAFFLDFDAGEGWAEQLGDLVSDGNADVAANLAPLDALGMSGWTDDEGVQHGLFALTTD